MTTAFPIDHRAQRREQHIVSRLLGGTAGLVLSMLGALAHAEMDVDQADSLNFGAFHEDKNDAIKIWSDDQSDEPIPVYTQTPVADTPSPKASQPADGPVASPSGKQVYASGQRLEIRQRYTLTRSTATTYSASYVIEPLHREMARLCPAGWRKLAERSEPIENDYYLYYEFQCL